MYNSWWSSTILVESNTSYSRFKTSLKVWCLTRWRLRGKWPHLSMSQSHMSSEGLSIQLQIRSLVRFIISNKSKKKLQIYMIQSMQPLKITSKIVWLKLKSASECRKGHPNWCSMRLKIFLILDSWMPANSAKPLPSSTREKLLKSLSSFRDTKLMPKTLALVSSLILLMAVSWSSPTSKEFLKWSSTLQTTLWSLLMRMAP